MKSMRSMAMGSMRSTKSMKFVELTERLLVLHHMTTSLLHNSKHGFHGFHGSHGLGMDLDEQISNAMDF